MFKACILLFILPFVCLGEDKPRNFPSIPKHMYSSTYRVTAYERRSGKEEYGVSHHSSAVAIDLSAHGLTEPRYLLTCHHAAFTAGKTRYIQIEIDKPGKLAWIDAQVIAFDENSDLCLLKTDSDLPFVAKLAMDDVTEIGDAIIAVGCPQGTVVTASLGYLSNKKMANEDRLLSSKDWWQGSPNVFHGNSGGPVFDANTEKVIGIVTAIIHKDKVIAPNVALFAGPQAVRKFVVSGAKKAIEKNAIEKNTKTAEKEKNKKSKPN